MRIRVVQLVLVGAALLLPMYAHAAASVAASPATVTLELDAGSSYAGTVAVTNPGQSALEFTPVATTYSVTGEDYREQFTSTKSPDVPSRWFVLDPARHTLGPGKSFTLPYKITVPKGTLPGGYYAAVFAQAASGERAGTVFYMTVKGLTKQEGSVGAFSSRPLQGRSPLVSTLWLRNDGHVHYLADVNLTIKDILGTTRAVVPAQRVILPGTTRRIALDWDGAPGFGFYRVGGTVKYLGRTETLPEQSVVVLTVPFALAMLALAGLAVAYGYLHKRRFGNVRHG